MDMLIQNVVKDVINDHTRTIVDEITERIEFFAQSKLKEIEESYQKKLIDQLYRRINNLENLCHAQNLQLNNACKEIDSLKEGTTDILKNNGCFKRSKAIKLF
jgi:hypothetical protein